MVELNDFRDVMLVYDSLISYSIKLNSLMREHPELKNDYFNDRLNHIYSLLDSLTEKL